MKYLTKKRGRKSRRFRKSRKVGRKSRRMRRRGGEGGPNGAPSCKAKLESCQHLLNKLRKDYEEYALGVHANSTNLR